MIILVMGVSGSGKTTIGKRLAESLGYHFADADDYHPASNKEKMHSGIPLTDADRVPWLAILRKMIDQWRGRSENAVLACSALKQSYREQLGFGEDHPADMKLVYLKGSPETLRDRLGHRAGHFMNPALLQSQFDTLEEPQNAIVVDVSGTPEEIVSKIRELVIG
jgi:gluconokinase